MQAQDTPPLIGRERALIDRLATQLHDAARSHHDYGPLRERPRGASFEVRILAEGGETGRIAKVTVELDRVEESRA